MTPIHREVRKETTWVDGVVRAAQHALDALDPATRTGRSPSDRYQVHLHVHADTGAAHWHLGPSISDTVRRLVCCDADLTAWVDDANHTLGLGRRQRLANRRLRRAIEHRDGGCCTVPGCVTHHRLGGSTTSGTGKTAAPPTPPTSSPCAAYHHRMIHIRAAQPRRQPRTRRAQESSTNGADRSAPERPTHQANHPTSPPAPRDCRHPNYESRSGEHADWSWFRWQ